MDAQEPSGPHSNRSFWLNPITVILCAGLLFFTSQLVGALFAHPLQLVTDSKNFYLFGVLLVGLLTLFGLLVIVKTLFKLRWQSLGFRKPKALYVAILPAVFIGYLIASMLMMLVLKRLIPGFDIDQAQDVGFGDPGSLLEQASMFASLVIITPVVEEVIFRGVLLLGLRKRLPFWAAAVITSLLFAAAHGQWNVAADTFVLSLLLCYLVEKSGSLVPAILLHAIKNCLAFILLFIVKQS